MRGKGAQRGLSFAMNSGFHYSIWGSRIYQEEGLNGLGKSEHEEILHLKSYIGKYAVKI